MKTVNYPEIPPVTVNSRPFWSVMIPTLDRPQYLEKALKSVLAQNIPSEDMQIEVIEDGEASQSVSELVKKIGSGRVSFFHRNGANSQAEQWTACIRRAKGIWVQILHDDDVLMPGFYKAYYDFIQKYSETRMVVCCAYALNKKDEPGKLLSGPPENSETGLIKNALEHLLLSNYISASSALVKREVYETIGGPDLSLKCVLDWELFLRIASRCPIGYICEPYICYRQHDSSVTTDYLLQGRNMEEAFMIAQRSLNLFLPEIRKNIWKAFKSNASRRSLSRSRIAIENKAYLGAWRHICWAFRLNPSWKTLLKTVQIYGTLIKQC